MSGYFRRDGYGRDDEPRNNFDKMYNANDYADDYGRYEDFPPERRERYEEPMKRQSVPAQPSQSQFQQAEQTSNVIVSYPQTYGDIQHLIDNLRNRQAIIVDIAKIDKADAQRILDFLSGAIYALGGSQRQITSTIYVLTPQGTAIKIPYEIQEKMNREKRNRK